MYGEIDPWEIGWMQSRTRKVVKSIWSTGYGLIIASIVLEKTHLLQPDMASNVSFCGSVMIIAGICAHLFCWHRRTLNDYRLVQNHAPKEGVR